MVLLGFQIFVFQNGKEEKIRQWAVLDKGSIQIMLHSALKTGPEVITLFHAQCWHRVRTDIEKSWKMTLVLENFWNSKKCNLSLNLSLNFEKISLVITKSP